MMALDHHHHVAEPQKAQIAPGRPPKRVCLCGIQCCPNQLTAELAEFCDGMHMEDAAAQRIRLPGEDFSPVQVLGLLYAQQKTCFLCGEPMGDAVRGPHGMRAMRIADEFPYSTFNCVLVHATCADEDPGGMWVAEGIRAATTPTMSSDVRMVLQNRWLRSYVVNDSSPLFGPMFYAVEPYSQCGPLYPANQPSAANPGP